MRGPKICKMCRVEGDLRVGNKVLFWGPRSFTSSRGRFQASDKLCGWQSAKLSRDHRLNNVIWPHRRRNEGRKARGARSSLNHYFREGEEIYAKWHCAEETQIPIVSRTSLVLHLSCVVEHFIS